MLNSTLVRSMMLHITDTEKRRNKLDENLLEGASGGSGLVLPEYMSAMTQNELRDILEDPNFIGSPEWEEFVELNPNNQQQGHRSKQREN